MFIGKNFTQRQRRVVDFKGIPIELYDYDWYEDGFFKLDPIGLEKKASLEIQGVGNIKNVETIKREFKEYLVEDHFKEDWEKVRELFEKIRLDILDLDSRIVEHAERGYIGYRLENVRWNVCNIHIYKSKLKVTLTRVEGKDLKDPENKIITVDWERYGYGKMCEFEVREQLDIDYGMFLIRQVYNRFYKEMS